jgi:hypothetical protein
VLLFGVGCSVNLRPLRYQFAGISGDRYDDNWLVIGGEVTTAAGGWSFADAALLTDECGEVSAWLRAVAARTVRVADPGSDGLLSPGLSFLEPVLAFSLAQYHNDRAVMRVHLSLEAAPPWRRGYGDDLFQYTVELQADEPGLLNAADQWDADLARFPPR